jgi:hypothetical protein
MEADTTEDFKSLVQRLTGKDAVLSWRKAAGN